MIVAVVVVVIVVVMVVVVGVMVEVVNGGSVDCSRSHSCGFCLVMMITLAMIVVLRV